MFTGEHLEPPCVVYDRFHWPREEDEKLDLSCDPRWQEVADRSRELKLKLDEDFSEQLTRKLLEELAWARRTFDSESELLRAVRSF